MFYSHSILKSTFPTPSTFPSKATELYNPKWTLMSVCCVCVKIWHLFHIRDRELKLISVCLINDYSLIADLHIFVYGRAECTMVKLLILNNFWLNIIGRITITQTPGSIIQDCPKPPRFFKILIFLWFQCSVQSMTFTNLNKEYLVDVVL